jgi:hemerythrin-like domain-containing protein/rubredoxin
MALYRCRLCGYVYNEDIGDPKGGVKAGTAFAELPKDWVCPICGARQDQFEKIDEPAVVPLTPIGILMIEHRLIERIVPVLKKEIAKMEQGNPADTEFLRQTADFFHTYADLIHHGKEENVLFASLKNKNISLDNQKLMAELLVEHEQSRENVKAFLTVVELYAAGDQTQTGEIINRLNFLLELYPRHIKNEDEIFFPESMKYFSDAEQQAMLAEMKEADKKISPDKYFSAIKLWEEK